MLTWQTYDFSQHDPEHYDKAEKTYGLVIFRNNEVFVIKTHEGKIGFPKGHREAETPMEAAIRELQEETGMKLVNPKVLGEVEMSMQVDYPEELLNRHINNLKPGEKPVWNRPGPHTKVLAFYVVKADLQKVENVDDQFVEEFAWMDITEALGAIPKSGSNQLEILQKALALV